MSKTKGRMMKMKARNWVKILSMMILCALTVVALRGMGSPVVATADAHRVVPANAGDPWYACTVARANSGADSGYVKLTNVGGDPCFALKWFTLPEGQKVEMIAAATHAMDTGQEVYVNVDIYNGVLPEIRGMSVEPKKGANHV
jgi:hypothetical protein